MSSYCYKPKTTVRQHMVNGQLITITETIGHDVEGGFHVSNGATLSQNVHNFVNDLQGAQADVKVAQQPSTGYVGGREIKGGVHLDGPGAYGDFSIGKTINGQPVTPAPSTPATLAKGQNITYGHKIGGGVHASGPGAHLDFSINKNVQTPQQQVVPGASLPFCFACGAQHKRISAKFCGQCGVAV